MNIREATPEDLHQLYELSNENSVRESSFSGRAITLAEHQQWFGLKLQDENTLFLLAEDASDLVGQLRLTKEGDEALVSISISAQSRQKGVGRRLLLEGIERLKPRFPQVRFVRALIKKENLRSVQFFERCGLHFRKELEIGGLAAVEYVYSLAPTSDPLIEMIKQRVFVIAELSANHQHNLDIALKTLRAIKDAGADAVKIQTYTADTITFDGPQEHFKIKQGSIWDGKTLYQLYQEAYTPWEWHPTLQRAAEELGLIFFSTPFDKTAVEFLQAMKVPLYKIASFEITDIPLIEAVAITGRPILMSTGIATLEEIEEAVAACRRMGNDQIILLKCTSAYPAPLEESNLLTIPDLAERFGVLSGLSDHTLGATAAVTAVALGARVIEKHFILERASGGPDAAFSMEPAEFRQMVEEIRKVEVALGSVRYDLSEQTKRSREFSRSLFAVEDIQPGERYSERNVRSIRPAYGLPPKFLPEIIGKRATRFIQKGTPLAWDHVE